MDFPESGRVLKWSFKMRLPHQGMLYLIKVSDPEL